MFIPSEIATNSTLTIVPDLSMVLLASNSLVTGKVIERSTIITRKRSVGVIGLGPAGLATVKELKHSGCFGVVTGFDRCCRVGGRWSLDSDTHDAGIWKELCANTTRRHMEFSDFSWDAQDGYQGHDQAYAGIYPHCTEARAYLEAYARKFDLYPNLHLETEVKSIEKVESGWRVTTRSSKDRGSKTNTITNANANANSNTCHHFDAIVVCNGPQAKAYHPLKPKFRDFAGKVLHSQNFRSEKDYKDQKVLVIGGNVSGSEIASVLAEGETATRCQTVVHSVRKMPYHIQKFTKNNNTSMDDNLYIRIAVWLDRILPDSLVAKGLQFAILFHWPEQCTTVAMPNCSVGVSPDIRKCGATVTKNYVDLVKKKRFDVKPEVAAVEGKRIVFADGSMDTFDVIICATGYDFDVSFLPESVQEKIRIVHPSTGKKVMNLYKKTLVPDPDLVNNLAFCGLINSLGPYFPQAEMQARYIAAIWSGKIPCPSPSVLQNNADASTKKPLDSSSILNNFDTAAVINEEIGDELGVTPSVAKAFWSPKKYLLGPIYASFYRTDEKAPGGDEIVAKVCQKRFDRLIASSPQVPHQTIEQIESERESLIKFNVECMLAFSYILILVGRF